MDNLRFRKLLLGYPKKAMELLYDQYFEILVRAATILVHDREAAEDIVQDTYLHIWKNYKKLSVPHDYPIKVYLRKVVRYKAITYYKKITRQNLALSTYAKDQVLTDPTKEASIIIQETAIEIRKVIDSFPPREQQCLLMKLDEELSIEQMAKRLNVTRKAIERSLTSANKRLKRYWLAKA